MGKMYPQTIFNQLRMRMFYPAVMLDLQLPFTLTIIDILFGCAIASQIRSTYLPTTLIYVGDGVMTRRKESQMQISQPIHQSFCLPNCVQATFACVLCKPSFLSFLYPKLRNQAYCDGCWLGVHASSSISGFSLSA